MKSKQLSILFVIKFSKQNKRGLCPINFRITYKKKRQEFSSGQFVSPKHWNSKTQRVSTKDVNCDFINGALLVIRQNINNAWLKLQLQQDEFQVDRWAEKIQTSAAIRKVIEDYLYIELPSPSYDNDVSLKIEMLFNDFKERYANYAA